MSEAKARRGPLDTRPSRVSEVRVLGLTGPAGSGKTSLLQAFARAGAATIEADAVYAGLVGPGSELPQLIAREFGAEVIGPDGSLNRHRLGELAFASADALARLSSVTHPALGRALAAAIESKRTEGSDRIVIEAAILLETPAAARCDEVWFVDAPAEVRVGRLMASRGWSEARARDLVRAQGEMTRVRDACDRVVPGTLSEDQLDSLVQTWIGDAT